MAKHPDAITGQSPERLEDARRALGPEVLAIRADAGSVTDAQALMTKVGEALGQIDVLFLNAGIAKFASLAKVTEAFFDEQFDVNVKAGLFIVQHAAPLLRPGASVIVSPSVNNRIGMAGTLVYAATKATARSSVRVLAGELASRQIRVNAISPGPVETPIYGKLGMPSEQVQAVAGSLIQKIPLGCFGEADEIAKAALFLASDDSSFLVGAEIVVDGGWTEVMP